MKRKYGRQQLGKRQLSEPNGRISQARYAGKISLDGDVWTVVVKDHVASIEQISSTWKRNEMRLLES